MGLPLPLCYLWLKVLINQFFGQKMVNKIALMCRIYIQYFGQFFHYVDTDFRRLDNR